MNDAGGEDEDRLRISFDSFYEQLDSWYHVLVVAFFVFFMFWIRIRTYDSFVQVGRVYFSGNDSWYHLRMVEYTVRHWPLTVPYDPWTYFPYGTHVGQFGTLYDQLVATAALILGLGTPSTDLVAKTLLVTPAVIGALTAVPTYLIGRRIAGRLGGLTGVLLLALLPGTFLRRGLVGFADHNIAEPFFQAFAIVAMLAALAVVNREKPVWELLAAREFDVLRGPAIWGALAGIATTLYLWTWPPGVLLLGIFGVFFALRLAADHAGGASPDHAAFAAATSMGVVGLLTLLTVDSAGFVVTKLSLLQPLFAFGVGAGAVFMAWLARVWEGRDLPRWSYPVAIGGLLFLAIGAISVLLPGLYSLLVNNLQNTIGFEAGAQTRTIGEAQPFLGRTNPSAGVDWVDVIRMEYGFALFTAIAAAGWMVLRPVWRPDVRYRGFVAGSLVVLLGVFLNPAGLFDSVLGVDYQLLLLGLVAAVVVVAAVLAHGGSSHLLIVVWAGIITAAAFTQVRFNYYLAVPVAVLNAYLVGIVLERLDLPETVREVRSIAPYKVAVLLVLALVIVAPLAVSVQVGGTSAQPVRTGTVMSVSAANQPVDVTVWASALDWMREETPREGTYGGADSEFDYYGTYERTDDFDYPDGTYGVLSWWDYGHWITLLAERVPNANPFQEGASAAADYLLAQNESEAASVLDRYDEAEGTRYVVIDWKMVTPGQKLFAPTVFKDGVDIWDFRSVVLSPTQGGYQVAFYRFSDRYYRSQMVRLYHYHGSAVDPSPVVVDWDILAGGGDRYVQVPQGGDAQPLRQFESLEEARAYVERDRTSRVGGIGTFPTETVPALEHYRLVYATPEAVQLPPGYVHTTASWVKVFERVPGATLRGTAPPNTTVKANVTMRVPTTNSTFGYAARTQTGPDGTFEFTLPYATTGYDAWGTEAGYTNTSVRAEGPYTVTTGASINESGYLVRHVGTVEVPEGAVLGEDPAPVEMTLREEVLAEPTSSGNGSSGPTITFGSGDDESSSTGNETASIAGVAVSGADAVAAREA